MTSSRDRVMVHPGIYRRGDIYEIRWYESGPDGSRRGRSRVVGRSLSEAKKVLVKARSQALEPGKRVEVTGLTLGDFLVDHYLPWAEGRITGHQDLARGTIVKYREYVHEKIVPAIGRLKLDRIDSAQVDSFLGNLRLAGRNPRADQGRPRSRSNAFYSRLTRLRLLGATYQRTAEMLTDEFPEYGVTTKAMVSRIVARAAEHQHLPSKPELSAATANKVRMMLRSAWRFGVTEGSIPRERDYVMRETRLLKDNDADEAAKQAAKITWTPAQYVAFFQWAESGPNFAKWLFLSTAGERRAGLLGLHWDDVDLDAKTACLRVYVKDTADRTEGQDPILVEYHDKIGKHSHELALDDLTVDVLRSWKSTQSAKLLRRADRHTCPTVQRACPLPGYHDRGLVFPMEKAPNGGNYYSPSVFSRAFQRDIERYNKTHDEQLPMIHIHSQRHGWSTFADRAGVSQAVRMDRLGHDTVATNDHYTGAPLDARVQGANATSDYMFAGWNRKEGTT